MAPCRRAFLAATAAGMAAACGDLLSGDPVLVDRLLDTACRAHPDPP